MIQKSVLLICVLIGSQGCAFTTATLDVNYDPATARQGPLSSIGPIEIAVDQFEDARSDQARIGYKKNGYGSNTADILPSRPVTSVVHDAVVVALQSNGHPVKSGGSRRIVGDVTQFWFDTQMNFWTIDFIGTVDCTLRVYAEPDGALLYESAYTGHYLEKSAGGYVGSWERVMNAALARMVESIIFDTDLAAALAEPRPDP